MRINCHCHVFNVQRVFGQKTKEILAMRLEREGWPKELAGIVMHTLEKIIRKPETGSDPMKVYPDLTKRIMRLNKGMTKEWRGVIRALTPKNADGWSPKGLEGFLRVLSWAPLIKDWDALHGDLVDLFKFLYIAFMPSISHVTAYLLEQLEPGDAIVPLMMDIDPEETCLYQEQIDQTAGQCRTYPGRILPFLAVHPRRKDAVDILKKEVGSGRFVGLKLYPSLGYNIDEAEDLIKYCNDTATPITMHCNSEGFYSDDIYRDNSHPRHWYGILKKYKSLKICLAHLGGMTFSGCPTKVLGLRAGGQARSFG
jgi:hypothetical protein